MVINISGNKKFQSKQPTIDQIRAKPAFSASGQKLN
jgi:hypothetical protein